MTVVAKQHSVVTPPIDGLPISRVILTRRNHFISKCERVLMVAPIFFAEIGFERLA